MIFEKLKKNFYLLLNTNKYLFSLNQLRIASKNILR